MRDDLKQIDPVDDFTVDPDSDLSEKQQLAVHLLARGVPVKDVAQKCSITDRQVYNWRTKNQRFISALTVAQVEVSARLIGQFGALSELGMRRIAEVLVDEDALKHWDPKDVVGLTKVLGKHIESVTPKLSYSETRTTKGEDDWNTAPADDGSTVDAEVIESDPVGGEPVADE